MNETDRAACLAVADLMAAAAHTAPKAHGMDRIVTLVLTEQDQMTLADVMQKMGEETGQKFFTRDAGNVRAAECVVVIGSKAYAGGLSDCDMCGYGDCQTMTKKDGICSLSATDLGVAIGSAVSVAAMHHIDNRVMYTIGRAALRMGLFAGNIKLAYGMPLKASHKNIFFDRGPGAVLK